MDKQPSYNLQSYKISLVVLLGVFFIISKASILYKKLDVYRFE